MHRNWSVAALVVGVGIGAALGGAVRSPALRRRARSLAGRGADTAVPTHIELPGQPFAEADSDRVGPRLARAIEEGIAAGSRAHAGAAQPAHVRETAATGAR